MREFLFRGKCLDNGEWVEGDLWYGKSVMIFARDGFPRGPSWNEVDPATVGQLTGLLDKDGTQIFEGDLCLCDRNINDEFDKTVFQIYFDPMRGYYGLSFSGNDFDQDCFALSEVIGNIHDSPELWRSKYETL